MEEKKEQKAEHINAEHKGHNKEDHPAHIHHIDQEHTHHRQGAKKTFSENLFLGLIILLGIIVLINIIFTFNINKELNKAAEQASEKSKPAEIEFTIIKNSKCQDCFDASDVADYVKTFNVKILRESSLEFDSNEGKGLVDKYKIAKVPAVILSGEIDKVNIEGFGKTGDVLLFSEAPVPYTVAATGEVKGMVTLIQISDGKCTKCNSLNTLLSGITGSGVKIAMEKKFEPSSADGKELIGKYKIGFVPAIILSKEFSAYEALAQAWPQIGTIESDGSYVLRATYPPYINLTTGKVAGIVNAVYLSDKSCAECYDVSIHRQILADQQGFALRLDKEENADISDPKGKELAAKYNITQVPTVILSGEVNVYPSGRALQQFFSVEKDGSYVFRNLAMAGNYKDLTRNEVVMAQEN